MIITTIKEQHQVAQVARKVGGYAKLVELSEQRKKERNKK